MSRRSFLRYGAGAAASAVVLPSLARTGLRESDGAASRRLAEAAGSYSYNLWSFDGAPEVAQVKQYEAAYNKLGKSQITLKCLLWPAQGRPFTHRRSRASSVRAPRLTCSKTGSGAWPRPSSPRELYSLSRHGTRNTAGTSSSTPLLSTIAAWAANRTGSRLLSTRSLFGTTRSCSLRRMSRYQPPMTSGRLSTASCSRPASPLLAKPQ